MRIEATYPARIRASITEAATLDRGCKIAARLAAWPLRMRVNKSLMGSAKRTPLPRIM